MTKINKEKIIDKLKYVFLRNQDNSKWTPLINIAKFIFAKIRFYFVFKRNDLDAIKKYHTSKHGESWVILHYQRITTPDKTPIPIADNSFVSPETFRNHCSILAEVANVISLQDLCETLSNSEHPPDGTVVLTIDGGFNDFLLHGAKPILDHNLPATLSVSTAFIGSKTFLLDDQIATVLKLFHDSNNQLPTLDSLTDKMKNDLTSTFENDLPSPKSVQVLMAILLSMDLNSRLKSLTELGEHLKKLSIDIPPWEDFLNWKDLIQLQELGFSIISKLHTNPFPLDLDKKSLSWELIESQKTFNTHSIPILPFVSLPYGIFSETVIDGLAEEGYKYALSSHIPLQVEFQEEFKVKILRRVLMTEGNSSSRDLFLSRLWDIR